MSYNRVSIIVDKLIKSSKNKNGVSKNARDEAINDIHEFIYDTTNASFKDVILENIHLVANLKMLNERVLSLEKRYGH